MFGERTRADADRRRLHVFPTSMRAATPWPGYPPTCVQVHDAEWKEGPMRTLTTLAVLIATCGAASAAAPKISGATATTQHPGVVLLLNKSGAALCSGILVWTDRVLAGASCIANADYVGMGSDFTTLPDDEDFYEITASTVHPDWNGSGVDYNLALLTIAGNDTYTPLMLDLGPRGDADIGRRGTVVGFGSASSSSPQIGLKRQGTFQVASVSSLHLLADGPTPNLCFGDAGGPFIATGNQAVMAMALFSDSGCNTFSGFHRLDVVAAFLTASTPLCTTVTPCPEFFVDVFEDGFED
jgi:hypothetical protein